MELFKTNKAHKVHTVNKKKKKKKMLKEKYAHFQVPIFALF